MNKPLQYAIIHYLLKIRFISFITHLHRAALLNIHKHLLEYVTLYSLPTYNTPYYLIFTIITYNTLYCITLLTYNTLHYLLIYKYLFTIFVTTISLCFKPKFISKSNIFFVLEPELSFFLITGKGQCNV